MSVGAATEIRVNSDDSECGKLKEKCVNSDVESIPVVVEELENKKLIGSDVLIAEKVALKVDDIEKENKKRRKPKSKVKRRRRSPDPAVVNISELMSSSLRIISPEKLVQAGKSDEEDDINSNQSLGLIVDKELDKSLEVNKLNNSAEVEVGKNANLKQTRKSRNLLSLKSSSKSNSDDSSQTNLNGFLKIKSSPNDRSDKELISKSSSNGCKKRENQSSNSTDVLSGTEDIAKDRITSKGETSSDIEDSLEKSCEEILEELSAFADNENSSKDKSSEGSLKQPSPKENVFNFMMHQRHKSIGMNYDGNSLEETPNAVEDNKDALAARKEKFEEWNNSRGMKRKKMEEEREDYCHAVLEKRSKKLKKMLSITPKKNGTKRKRIRRVLSSESNSDDSTEDTSPDNKKPKDNPTLMEDTVDVEVFKKHTNADVRSNKVQKGLLSFFGVLDSKKAKTEVDVVNVNEGDDDDGSKPASIKVKMFSPRTTRKRSTKIDESSNDPIATKMAPSPSTAKPKPIALDESSNSSIYSGSESNQSAKPKRTRRSKKTIMSLEKMKATIKLKMDKVIDLTESNPGRRTSGRLKVAKNYNEDEVDDGDSEKKPVKIASIFNVKPKVDPRVLEARKNFLYSDSPEKIKKQAQKAKVVEELEVFPRISHVLQRDPAQAQEYALTMTFENNVEEDLDLDCGNFKFESLTRSKLVKDKVLGLRPPDRSIVFKACVQQIKEANPEYPVNKFFRILHAKSGYVVAKRAASPKVKRGRGRPKKKPVEAAKEVTTISLVDNNQMWTEKYKAQCSDDIIGNQKSMTALKNWLSNWIQFTEEVGKAKKVYRRGSSDFESTDCESRDGGMPGNGMILRGPTSSGKTSGLYAICNELNINVIELNASSKRTGKRLLQELQEATQSHQVRKKASNPLSSFLQKTDKKEEKAESSRKMCLLLVEDVDIVFDQDEGFISGLTQLFVTSKRPIVLTMSDVDCSHLHKFTSQYPVLKFNPLSVRSLGVWLQILCLVEGLKVDLGSLSELLEWNKGDVRRTLLQLQFWGQTGGDCNNAGNTAVSYIRNSEELEKLNKSDDYSHDDVHDVSFLPDEASAPDRERVHKNCIGTFLVHEIDEFSLPYPLDLGNVWWNLPTILNFKPIAHESATKEVEEVKEDLTRLESLAEVCDAMSLADVALRTEDADVELEPCVRSWNKPLKSSLNFQENMDGFRGSFEKDLTHSLVEGYCKLHKTEGDETGISMAAPSLDELRWRRRRHDCEATFLDAIPLSSWTDHAAFSTDYFPILRQISRTEVVRSDNNNKRGNRFYNYLRTLNVNPSNLMIKTACDMFQ